MWDKFAYVSLNSPYICTPNTLVLYTFGTTDTCECERQLLQAGGWSPDPWPRGRMAAAVCRALHSKNLLRRVNPTEFLFFQKNFKLVSSRPAGLIADQRIFLQQQSEWILFYCWYSLFCRIIGSLKIVYLLGRIQSINRNFGTGARLPPLLQFWIFLQIIWVAAAADDFSNVTRVFATYGRWTFCDLFPYGLGRHQSLRPNIKFLSPAIRVRRNIIAGFVSQWLWLFDAIAQSPLVLNMLAGGRVGGGGDAVLHTEPGTRLYFSNVFLPLYFLNYIFLSTFVFIDNIFEKKNPPGNTFCVGH